MSAFSLFARCCGRLGLWLVGGWLGSLRPSRRKLA